MTEQTSEDFGSIPNASAPFGNAPHDAEAFRNFRNGAERTEHHTLTVRDVARLFEESGVSRTERSIINWCQPNRQGVARLDAFFDTNERKYFITPESTTRAIQEEQAKAAASGDVIGTAETPGKKIPNGSERSAHRSDDLDDAKNLEAKIRDLEITNRAKDYYIDELKTDRNRFQEERQGYVERLIASSLEIGELRSKVFLLGATPKTVVSALPNGSENQMEKADGVSENNVGRVIDIV